MTLVKGNSTFGTAICFDVLNVERMSSAAHLPAEVSVVHVTYKQGLGGESVWLNIHICSCNLKGKTKNCYITIIKFTHAKINTQQVVNPPL